MAKQYTAAVIGCGVIGTGQANRKDDCPASHAGMYFSHPQTQLAAVMDLDPDRAKQAAGQWQCDAYSETKRLLEEVKPDLVSICVPDAAHYECLKLVADCEPKAVICEKPLTLGAKLSREIVELYGDRGIPLAVNYSRRYSRDIIGVKECIDRGEMGRLLGASFRYTRGLGHNGTHAVNLACYTLGRLEEYRILSAVTDTHRNDPSVTFWGRFEKCDNVFFQAGDAREYSLFEWDLLGSERRFFFDEFGFRGTRYRKMDAPGFPGYSQMGIEKVFRTDLHESMRTLLENVMGHLNENEPLLCSGEDCLAGEAVCEEICGKVSEVSSA